MVEQLETSKKVGWFLKAIKKMCITLTILIIVCGLVWFFTPTDWINKISRKGIEFSSSDYKVSTLQYGNSALIWEIKNEKITTVSDKGYYFFWEKVNGKRLYRQVPIALTVIEEK